MALRNLTPDRLMQTNIFVPRSKAVILIEQRDLLLFVF